MSNSDLSTVARRGVFALSERAAFLWGLAVVFYGVGDVSTTALGLGTAGVVEVGPVAGPVLSRFGFGAVLGLKLGLFALGYCIWRAAPSPAAVGVPLSLGILGALVSAWNLIIVFTATLR
jgi:hypothetical protein